MSEQLCGFREILRSRARPGARTDRQARTLLRYLFTSTRGGPTRLRIIMMLLERPYNTHQLARGLGFDYKAIQHHMRVLERNNMVSRDGVGYGAEFRPSAFLEANIASLAEAVGALERKLGRRKVYY